MDFKSVSVFLCLLVLSQATPHRIPLRVLRLKKDLESPISGSGTQISTTDSALVIDVNVNYEKYSVALDSFSDLLWLADTNCKSSFCTKATTKIKPAKDNPITAYHGKVLGNKIEGSPLEIAGITAAVDVVAVNFVDVDIAKRLPSGVDGVLGLADSNAFNSLQPNQNIISLYISKRNPPKIDPTNKDISALYFEKDYPSDLTKRGLTADQLKFIPSDNTVYWKSSIDYISNCDGPWAAWSVGGADVVLDTTYSGIAGPAGEVDSINKYIGTDDDGYIDCYKVNYLRPIKFHINGRSFNLDPKNYIKMGEKKLDIRCKSLFEAHESTKNIWRLGIAFLHQYLAVIKLGSKSPEMTFVELKYY